MRHRPNETTAKPLLVALINFAATIVAALVLATGYVVAARQRPIPPPAPVVVVVPEPPGGELDGCGEGVDVLGDGWVGQGSQAGVQRYPHDHPAGHRRPAGGELPVHDGLSRAVGGGPVRSEPVLDVGVGPP